MTYREGRIFCFTLLVFLYSFWGFGGLRAQNPVLAPGIEPISEFEDRALAKGEETGRDPEAGPLPEVQPESGAVGIPSPIETLEIRPDRTEPVPEADGVSEGSEQSCVLPPEELKRWREWEELQKRDQWGLGTSVDEGAAPEDVQKSVLEPEFPDLERGQMWLEAPDKNRRRPNQRGEELVQDRESPPNAEGPDAPAAVEPPGLEPARAPDISYRHVLGTPLELTLYNVVWTYIASLSGYPERPVFEREIARDTTLFKVEFPKEGEYSLTFSRQSADSGKLEYYTVEVIVERPEEPETLVSEERDQPRPEDSRTRIIGDLRSRLRNGELDSVYETLTAWPESRQGGRIFEEAAQALAESGDDQRAAELWDRNLKMDGELGTKALRGVLSASLRQNRPEEFPRLLDRLLSLSESPDSGVLQSDYAAFYRAFSDPGFPLESTLSVGDLLTFYETYTDQFPDRNRPGLLYQMGALLEKPGESQDLRRARKLYQEIERNYPVSEYSLKAAGRLHDLNRQFFVVR